MNPFQPIVPSPNDLWEQERARLEAIAAKGRVCDLLLQIAKTLTHGKKKAVIAIAEYLTDDEYRALQHVMYVQQWWIRYSVWSRLTGPKLVVTQVIGW